MCIQLSSCNMYCYRLLAPQAFTLKCLCIAPPTPTLSSCRTRRWNFNLDSLLDINHAPLISMFCAQLLHTHLSPRHHQWGGQRTSSDSSRLRSSRLWTSLSLRLACPLGLIFPVVKAHGSDHIPLQLSWNHLIPITLITAAGMRVRGRREWPREERGQNSHLREQECECSRIPDARQRPGSPGSNGGGVVAADRERTRRS